MAAAAAASHARTGSAAVKEPNPGRRALSDITNTDRRPSVSSLDLAMKNAALVKLLEEKNKMIELSAIEIKKLRLMLGDMAQQNRQFAQIHTQMLMELNAGKDKLKALQHDLGCANARVKVLMHEVKDNNRSYQQGLPHKDSEQTISDAAPTEFNPSKEDVTSADNVEALGGTQCGMHDEAAKCSNTDRRKSLRNRGSKGQANSSRLSTDTMMEDTDVSFQSLPDKPMSSRRKSIRLNQGLYGPAEEYAAKLNVQLNETDADNQSVQNLPTITLTEEKMDTKRALSNAISGPASKRLSVGRPVRRTATKVAVYKNEPAEEDEKIDEQLNKTSAEHKDEASVESRKFEKQSNESAAKNQSLQNLPPISMTAERMAGEGVANNDISNQTNLEQTESRRSSIGRPVRRAATKVVTYKEIPLNVKMRR